MADTKKNALAELAIRLGTDALSLGADKYPEIVAAQRIVAALAKVEPGRVLGGGVDIDTLLNLETMYEACRAIAEEGAGDGK